MVALLAVIAFALAPLRIAAAAEGAPSARALLEQAKETLGGAAWDQVKALRTVTVFDAGGRRSERESLVDLTTGRYVTTERGVPSGARDGFDGRFGWKVLRGLLLLQPDQREARTAAYMKAKGYLFPDRFPAQARYLGEAKDDDGRVMDAVSLEPSGGSAVELDLDARTHRPVREVYRSSAAETTVRYGDPREVGGLWFAFRAELKSSDGAKLAAVTEEVALDPELRPGTFACPTVPFSFENGAASADVPARHGVIVRALVGGKGPFPFVLDTGGRAQVTPALASRAGLIVERGVARAGEVAIGGLVLRGLAFDVTAELGPAAEAASGEAAAGLLGVETFLSLAVEIDAKQEHARLLDRRGFAPPRGGTLVAVEFAGSKPVAEAEVEGTKGRFILDTGSNADVILFPRFLAREGLKLERGTEAHVVVGSARLGARKTQGRGLRLGGVEVGAVGLFPVEGDPPGLPDADGVIGMGVLGRFSLAFDYRSGSVYLGPQK